MRQKSEIDCSEGGGGGGEGNGGRGEGNEGGEVVGGGEGNEGGGGGGGGEGNGGGGEGGVVVVGGGDVDFFKIKCSHRTVLIKINRMPSEIKYTYGQTFAA